MLMLLVLSRTAAAQTAAPPPPPAREGSAEFAGVATSGNTSTRSIGLSGEITFRPGKWVYNAKVGFINNEVENVLAARSFVTTFRASRELNTVVALFGQFGYLTDRFSGIDDRVAVEGGVSATWIKGRQTFAVDGSAGYANEQRLVPPNLSTAVAGAGARYKVKISETSDFTEELRYTQSLSTGADYRCTNLAALTAKLNGLLSLKVSNLIRFVNAPVPGFEKTDLITSTALVVTF